MIPILAAASAINMIDKVANGAASAWKHLSGSNHATGKPEQTHASVSFAATLATQIAKT